MLTGSSAMAATVVVDCGDDSVTGGSMVVVGGNVVLVVGTVEVSASRPISSSAIGSKLSAPVGTPQAATAAAAAHSQTEEIARLT
ncbi:MAG: hypothetical protein AAF945_20085 [Actinomycetota bacterium]